MKKLVLMLIFMALVAMSSPARADWPANWEEIGSGSHDCKWELDTNMQVLLDLVMLRTRDNCSGKVRVQTLLVIFNRNVVNVLTQSLDGGPAVSVKQEVEAKPGTVAEVVMDKAREFRKKMGREPS